MNRKHAKVVALVLALAMAALPVMSFIISFFS